MGNHNADGYAGIDISAHVWLFLSGVIVASLKISVLICESQFSYSTDFHACAFYLILMVQKTPSAKQVNIVAAATENIGIKHYNRAGTDQCLMPAKYSKSVFNMPGKIKRKPRPMGTTSW